MEQKILENNSVTESVATDRVEKSGKPPKKKNKFKDYMIKTWPLYVMAIPLVVYLFIFNYIPMFGLQLAFKDWNARLGIWGSHWATDADGTLNIFKNFQTLFSTSLFSEKLVNTLRISLLKILCGFPVPIILVLLMNELTSNKFMKSVQAVSYLPYFISWVVLGGIFLEMFSAGSFIQGVLQKLFGKEIYFFSDSDLYVTFIILSDIYKGCGWGTIIYLAALANIDPQLYEAASLDGASRWKKMLYITLPGLLPAIEINIILSLSNVMYAGFDQIYNTYNSAVQGKGDVLETYIYRIGIGDGDDYATATAVGLFNSAIGCVLVLIANKVIKLLGGEGIW